MILINNFASIVNLRGLMRNMKPQKIDIQQKDNWIPSNFWKNRQNNFTEWTINPYDYVSDPR
jgi:hypothetical protein